MAAHEKIDVKIKHKADLPFDLKAPEIAPPRLVLSEHPTHGYRALLHPEISDDHTEMPEHKMQIDMRFAEDREIESYIMVSIMTFQFEPQGGLADMMLKEQLRMFAIKVGKIDAIEHVIWDGMPALDFSITNGPDKRIYGRTFFVGAKAYMLVARTGTNTTLADEDKKTINDATGAFFSSFEITRK